jgi:hypothetical protein
MQKNHFVSPRTLVRVLVFLLLPSLLFLSSCKDKKEFKINCVLLTKAQIQTWVDSGWTKPADANRIKSLLLQFYSGDASSANSNMQLITYPGKSMNDVKVNGQKILGIDTTCVAKKLTGKVVFANNMVGLSNLKIFNPDGTLNDFDYIRFIPEQKFPPYINFAIEIVRKEGVEVVKDYGSWPCPPYCGIIAAEQ